MIDSYTDSEICSLYRRAKDKELQIGILTELTGLRDFQINKILEEGGYLMKEEKPINKTDIEVPNAEKMKELHAQGLTQKKIAKEIGVAQSTVQRYMKILGLEPNHRHPYRKKEEKEVEKKADYNVVEKMREETKKNVEELKEVLPNLAPDPDDLPIDYELVNDFGETLTAQQYYELAKITLHLLKLIWEG